MAMKRPAAAKVNPVKSRCATVKGAIESAEGCPERVQEMLVATLPVTLGQIKEKRHPFNERFVAMIEEVLKAEQARLVEEETKLDAAFKELSPDKAAREAAVEEAKAAAAQKAEELKGAEAALAEKGAALKEASAAVVAKKAEQSSGDKALEAAQATKEKLEETQKDALAPLIDGGALADEDKKKKVQAVMDAGKTFSFDASLMSTAAKVFEKAASERGGFDATCIEQLQSSFAASVAKFDAELAAGAPARAARAEAVAEAEAAAKDAEAAKEAAETALQAATDANTAAIEAEKAAEKRLADFMPELRDAGDNLDAAKEAVKDFEEAMQAFSELKDLKEGDFAPPEPTEKSYYETIDGMGLDRAVIDACRTAVAGTGDGRVSVDDAKTVFEKIADGGKETQAERWTLRYCMQEFKWTEAAHDWIVTELKKVPQEGAAAESPAKKAKTEGAGYYETVDGFKCDRGIIDACREAMGGQGDGRVSVEDAQKVWAKAADGNKVTDAEKWTLRYCLAGFNWTRAAHDWMLDQLHKEASK